MKKRKHHATPLLMCVSLILDNNKYGVKISELIAITKKKESTVHWRLWYTETLFNLEPTFDPFPDPCPNVDTDVDLDSVTMLLFQPLHGQACKGKDK